MDMYGKFLEEGDKVLIIAPKLFLSSMKLKNALRGIVFAICEESKYRVYLDEGPHQPGWAGWGSEKSVLVPGAYLMRYDYQWSLV